MNNPGNPAQDPLSESTGRQNKKPLIRTKFFIPQTKKGLVARPQVLAKMERSLNCALTLISAPAGYGKTTILTEWLDNLNRQKSSPSEWMVGWLSLDAEDNDLARFMNYLSAVIQNIHPLCGDDHKPKWQTQQENPTTALSSMVNDLYTVQKPILIILDDYQYIGNPDIHEVMTSLLEHLPANAHVLIATRSDPPLPLARLRVQNQLTEIRAEDLRFDSAETASYLNELSSLSLTPEQIVKLDTRTEGWIAGLQMAALSLQGRTDVDRFIEDFSGSHRFIMDYLTEEILNRLPCDTQDFLLCTSVLDSLCAPLCDEIMLTADHDDSPNKENRTSSQDRLLQLEKANLFIVPLDDNRTWFRYHHLFSELLRTRLQHQKPGLLPLLHKQASMWFEKNNRFEEAISHALAAKDWNDASRLIERNIPSFLDNSQMATIIKWIIDLPDEVIFKNTRLCVLVADVYSQAGLLEQIDPYLNKAEEILLFNESHHIGQSVTKPSAKEETVIRSMIGNLRGLKAVCTGEPTCALAITQKTLNDVPDMDVKERAILYWVEGWAYRSIGDLDRALKVLLKASEYGQQSGANLHDILTDLGFVYQLMGRLDRAVETYSKSNQMSMEHGDSNQSNLARNEVFLSLLLLEQNKLDQAFDHADRAVKLTQWWPSRNILAMAFICIAKILLIRGDLNGSLEALLKTDRERKNHLMTPFVHSLADTTWARYWMRTENWTQLQKWSNDQLSAFAAAKETDAVINEYQEMRQIMTVRVLIEQNRLSKREEAYEICLDILCRLENSSKSSARFAAYAEVLFLRQLIHHLQGKKLETTQNMEICLDLAARGGFARIFIDSGENARLFLSDYVQRSSSRHKTYVNQIIQSFGTIHGAGQKTGDEPDQITPRELEVLQLLAEGYDNEQIAENLVVSRGTVKFHVHHILEKLQASSRIKAVIKARELKLIE